MYGRRVYHNSTVTTVLKKIPTFVADFEFHGIYIL